MSRAAKLSKAGRGLAIPAVYSKYAYSDINDFAALKTRRVIFMFDYLKKKYY